MGINPIKRVILEVMAGESRPRRPKKIAEKAGLNFSSCMMHIIGLKKAGYVSSPEKGYYGITDAGREVLGPRLGKEEAANLLSPIAPERAFYFYTGVNEYSGLRASSLLDFCEKVKEVDLKSLEFHLARRDFERWLEGIGDPELARRIGDIRERARAGEELRKTVYEVAKTRLDELMNVSEPHTIRV